MMFVPIPAADPDDGSAVVNDWWRYPTDFVEIAVLCLLCVLVVVDIVTKSIPPQPTVVAAECERVAFVYPLDSEYVFGVVAEARLLLTKQNLHPIGSEHFIGVHVRHRSDSDVDAYVNAIEKALGAHPRLRFMYRPVVVLLSNDIDVYHQLPAKRRDWTWIGLVAPPSLASFLHFPVKSAPTDEQVMADASLYAVARARLHEWARDERHRPTHELLVAMSVVAAADMVITTPTPSSTNELLHLTQTYDRNRTLSLDSALTCQ